MIAALLRRLRTSLVTSDPSASYSRLDRLDGLPRSAEGALAYFERELAIWDEAHS